MTWTAPELDRDDPPYVGDERTQLESWLEYHRLTLLKKCAGLTGEQLARRAAEPSSLSLLGLVRHMAAVERWWFRLHVAGAPVDPLYWSDASPDGDFDDVDPAAAEADFATYAEECARAREAAAGRALDETFHHAGRGVDISVRWVYIHMIEEYARHNGHADLLRERIDGVTGE